MSDVRLASRPSVVTCCGLSQRWGSSRSAGLNSRSTAGTLKLHDYLEGTLPRRGPLARAMRLACGVAYSRTNTEVGQAALQLVASRAGHLETAAAPPDTLDNGSVEGRKSSQGLFGRRERRVRQAACLAEHSSRARVLALGGFAAGASLTVCFGRDVLPRRRPRRAAPLVASRRTACHNGG